MKTTLDLPDELIREVKLRAVMQGRSLKDLVADFIRQGLGMVPATPAQMPSPDSVLEIDRQGLPVIRCRPDAKAAQKAGEAGVDELLKLEQLAQTAEDLLHVGHPV